MCVRKFVRVAVGFVCYSFVRLAVRVCLELGFFFSPFFFFFYFI